MKYLIIVLCLSIAACTDAGMSQWTALGNSGDITCYSGGKIIYQGKSTGKIATEQNSDGWFFREAGTQKLIRISGACVVSN